MNKSTAQIGSNQFVTKRPFLNKAGTRDVFMIVLIGYVVVTMIMNITQFVNTHNFRTPINVHFEFSIKPQMPWTQKVVSPIPTKDKSLGQQIKDELSIKKVNAAEKTPYMETPTYVNSTQGWKDFVTAAYKLAPIYDYPVNVLLSQAALESARGTSHYAVSRNNFFGMNCNDGTEDRDCTYYSTPEESIVDYMHLIKRGGRYYSAYQVREYPEQMIAEIKKAGYASDDNYISKVMRMAEWSL